MILRLLFLSIWVVVAQQHITNEDQTTRSFTIDYSNGTFLMDGKPFRYVAGSIHYFRSPHQYWRDRLRALRAAGLNAVTTYVEWSFHEPERGEYHWTGDQDLVNFIELAQEEEMFVILRPGPYICAERDLGGFPYWLLHYYPSIKLRTNDADYKKEVIKWYAELMPKMKPLLYGNGGPIIMVQVENEYGSFPACDSKYMSWLANLTKSWVEDSAVLFTTDGSSAKMLRCGTTPDVFPTVDFGSETNVDSAWNLQRNFTGGGPLVNSEYYPGWLTHWGEAMANVSALKVARTLDKMLAMGGNVNFYMFHGGTNFDYTAGANLGATYTPDLTSYDYDAPLSEAGDPTPKYEILRKVILKYMPAPGLEVPEIKLKGSSDPVTLTARVALLSTLGREALGRETTHWDLPPSMEALRQRSGLTLYETFLPANFPDPSALLVNGLKDRALVYMNGEFVGILSRSRKLYVLPVMPDHGRQLQILVENQGRVNYGPLVNDFKGILGNVTLNNIVLRNWKVTTFPLETADVVDLPVKKSKGLNHSYEFLRQGPVVYAAKFQLRDETVLDTFLDVTGWGKGLVWVNGKHLGRYWPKERPQVTLYTPGVYLNRYPDCNTIVMLELQKPQHNLTVQFVSKPKWI